MQKKTLFVIFLIIVSSFCQAKEFVVESFSHLSADRTARLNPRTDLNEDECALIMVKCPIKDCQFSEAVGAIDNKDNVYYVYLSPGTRRLSIRCSDHDNLNFDFKSISEILGVKSGETYVMTLSSKDNAKKADVLLFDNRRGIVADSISLLPVDISARTKERMDASGEKCALIKISLPIPRCSFRGIVGSPEFNINEYNIYLSPDADKFFLQCPGFTEIPIIIAEKLNGEKLQSLSTYRLYVSGYNTSFVEFSPQFRNLIDQYEEVNEFNDGFAKVRKNGKYGIITTAGYEAIPCNYDELESDGFNEGFARIKKNGKYGYISMTGIELIPCIYDELHYFVDGKAVVKRNGLYGFINLDGEEIIPCLYDQFENSSSAMFHAETDKFKLNRVLNGSSLAIMFENNGLLGFLRDGKWGLINFMGEEFYPYDKYDKFWESQENGISMVSLNGKVGLIDIHGKEIVPCKYDRLFIKRDLPHNAIAVIYDTNPNTYIDKEGKILDSSKSGHVYTMDKYGLIKIERNGFFGLVNSEGEEIAPCIYHDIDNFKDGLALAQKGDKSKSRFEYCSGMIDTLGREVVPFNYDGLIFFNEYGFAPVKDMVSRKYGIINRAGIEVVPCIYDYLDVIYNSKTRVKENLFKAKYRGKCGLINLHGDIIVPFQYDGMSNNTYNGLISVYQDHNWGVYNFQINKEVVPCNYENFRFTDDLIISDGISQHIEIFDFSGKRIIPYELNYINGIKNGLYIVSKETSLGENKFGIIDNTGKNIIPYKYTSLSSFNENEDLFKVHNDINNKYGLINLQDEIITPFIYDYIGQNKGNNDKYFIVEQNDRKGLLNHKGEEIVSCIYDYISSEKDNIFGVKKNGMYGFITVEGKEIISCKYDKTSDFINGISYVELNGKSGIINIRGEEIWFK